MMFQTVARRKLSIVFAGTGRDGTVSLSHMIRELFEKEGRGRTVMHEYASREFGQLFADFKETGDEAFREKARGLIQSCEFDCIVGNGIAHWLPEFAEIGGADLRIMRIRRLDRERCIASLVENATMFPAAYGYYVDSAEAVWRRMTAFHFGEMTRDEWFSLDLTARLRWYFDKTHALLDNHANQFGPDCEFHTETLNTHETRLLLGEIVGLPGLLPGPKHLNSHVFASSVAADRQLRMQWLFGLLDLNRAAADEVYAMEFFLDAFVSWTGYQIQRSPHITAADYRNADELQVILSRAAEAIGRSQKLVELLEIERKRLASTLNAPGSGE